MYRVRRDSPRRGHPVVDDLKRWVDCGERIAVAAVKKSADQYPTLDTAKLGDLNDEYYYGADCGACGHMGGRLSLLKLRAHLGPEFPLVDVRKRFRCGKCGKRQAIVTYWTPAHRGGSLVHLFDRKPKE